MTELHRWRVERLGWWVTIEIDGKYLIQFDASQFSPQLTRDLLYSAFIGGAE